MSGRVDLHVHSHKSCDGDFSPEELAGFARDHELRAISIADHDTVAAYPEAMEAGRAAGVEVIPSIEVTTIFGGREFHLLLPFVVSWDILSGIVKMHRYPFTAAAMASPTPVLPDVASTIKPPG